jgi:hypothetical protein
MDLVGHPAVPLRKNPATGTFATVAQDSPVEVKQCARAVLRTMRGRRIEHPELGVSDPLWRTSVDVDEIGATLDEFEDRADWEPILGLGGQPVGMRVAGVR